MSSSTKNKNHFCPYCGARSERLYTVESVAEILECSVDKVRKMIQRREISYRKIGHLVRIPDSEIDRIGKYFPRLTDQPR